MTSDICHGAICARFTRFVRRTPIPAHSAAEQVCADRQKFDSRIYDGMLGVELNTTEIRAD